MSKPLPKSAALDPRTVAARRGSAYPDHFKPRVAGREKRALGSALGLVNFGVNLVKLEPGAQSALRVEGEITLVTNAGPELLKPGMCAGFPKGKADGHHLVNNSGKDAWYLEVGDRMPGDGAHYPDDDLRAETLPAYRYLRKDGTPY
jgi:uncharacterized cupin superfamily protein